MNFINNLKNNLNIKLPKFGTGGGTSRYKNIIIFIIFILSISIRSFGIRISTIKYMYEGSVICEETLPVGSSYTVKVTVNKDDVTYYCDSDVRGTHITVPEEGMTIYCYKKATIKYMYESNVIWKEEVDIGEVKLKETVEMYGEEYSFDWKENLEDKKCISMVQVPLEGKSVYANVITVNQDLKIPVRVKINYDPSNNLESWVRAHVRHKFYRKLGENSWTVIEKASQPTPSISLVSTKIGVDGTKTQDFIFSYTVKDEQDRNKKSLYKFGFDKEYKDVKDDSSNYGMKAGNAFMTYMKQDVGGGKKLFIDYDIDPKQILENYENYNSAS